MAPPVAAVEPATRAAPAGLAVLPRRVWDGRWWFTRQPSTRASAMRDPIAAATNEAIPPRAGTPQASSLSCWGRSYRKAEAVTLSSEV
ncbi:MAG: hypothetical protein ACRDX8_00505 [Acidimicrobiales bacterium]